MKTQRNPKRRRRKTRKRRIRRRTRKRTRRTKIKKGITRKSWTFIQQTVQSLIIIHMVGTEITQLLVC